METHTKKKLVKFQSPLVPPSAAVSRNMSEEEEVRVKDVSADGPVVAPAIDKTIEDPATDEKTIEDPATDEKTKDFIKDEIIIDLTSDEKSIADISMDDKSVEDLFVDDKPVKPDKVEEVSDEGFGSGNQPDESMSTTPNDSQKDEKEVEVLESSGTSKPKKSQKSPQLSKIHKSSLAAARAPKSKRKSRVKERRSSDAQKKKGISIEMRCTYNKEPVPTKASVKSYEDWSLYKNVLDEYEKLDDQGTWIECTKVDCHKWRFVPTVHDPSLVPEYWECSMNPGRDHRTCGEPEVLPDEEEGKRLVLNEFTAGSLVWAQQIGYPWWPSLVDIDPDCVSYYLNCSRDVEDTSEVWYHVTFIDPLAVTTRAWIKRARLKPYYSMPRQQPLKLSKNCKKYEQRIVAARHRANKVEPLSLENRLRVAGFVNTYCEKGKVSSRNEELPAMREEQPLVSQENDDDSSDSEDLYLSRLVRASQDSSMSFTSVGGIVPLKKGSRSSENDQPSQKSKRKSKKQNVSPQSKKQRTSPSKQRKLSSLKVGVEFKKQREIPQSKNLSQSPVKQKSLSPKKSDSKSQKLDKTQQSQKQGKSPVKPKNLTLQKNSLNPKKQSKSLPSEVQRSESPLKQDGLSSQEGAKQPKKKKNKAPRKQKDLEQETSSQRRSDNESKKASGSPRKRKSLSQETSPPRKRVAKPRKESKKSKKTADL